MVDPERLILAMEGDETLRDAVGNLVRAAKERLGASHRTVYVGGIKELDEAVQEVKDREGSIDLALFDISHAPGSLPEEVVERIVRFREEMPGVKVISFGDLPFDVTREQIEKKIGTTFLEAPLDIESFEQRIEDALK